MDTPTFSQVDWMPPPPLSETEIEQLVEILDRRANDVASFKEDVERALNRKLDEFRGSADLALSRETFRLRRLSARVRSLSRRRPIVEEEEP